MFTYFILFVSKISTQLSVAIMTVFPSNLDAFIVIWWENWSATGDGLPEILDVFLILSMYL